MHQKTDAKKQGIMQNANQSNYIIVNLVQLRPCPPTHPSLPSVHQLQAQTGHNYLKSNQTALLQSIITHKYFTCMVKMIENLVLHCQHFFDEHRLINDNFLNKFFTYNMHEMAIVV